jgi:DNA-binding SARP family transcriptional activator
MAALRLALLGGFEARLQSGESLTFARKKAQALLAYLALHPDQLQPRDKLAALLWGEASDTRARHSLRQALVSLRQSLPRTTPPCLVEDADAVALRAAHVEVDALVFERLAGDSDPDRLERAAALYRGPLLEGIAVTDQGFEEWLVAERERLRELALDTLAKLLGHQARSGPDDRAVQTAVRLLALDPAQEPIHRTLMRLYARQGRRGAALRQYQACVSILEREFGIGPEAETRALYRELLVAAPGGALAEPVAAAPVEWAQLDPPVTDTPLVGRAEELDRLRRALEAAWQGAGRAALVLGEAGVGKSRLVEAVVAEAAAGGRVLVGRAHESEQILPFGPWVDLLRTVMPSIARAVGEPWHGELARLFPELGPAAAPQPSRGEEYLRLFEGVSRVVQTLAADRPLLIVLEDLHWADETSLRLLVSLTHRLTDRRVLVLGTLRSEELVDAPILRRVVGQLGHQPDHVAVTLSPLTQAETVSLVRVLAGTRSDEATTRRLGERIWRFSEGNPLMAVETFRALRDHDALAGDGAPTLPPRVRALVAARLERLTGRGRRLAGIASVIGRDFEFAVLRRAAEANDADVADGVEELVGRGILRAVGERIDFTHERIREVVYESLLVPYRRVVHKAVARAIETGPIAGLAANALALGRHYHAAEEWEPASRYLVEAGRLAAARGASHEAIASFEQALDALGRLPSGREHIEQAIDIRLELRQSCVPLADHRRIARHLGEAEAAALSIGDRERLGWILVYRIHGQYLAADCPAATETARRSLEIVEALGDPLLEESANVYAAQIYHWTGAYRDAVARLGRNVDSLEARLGERGVRAKHYVNTRMFLAWSLAELGEFPQAAVRAREAIDYAEESDSVYWLVHAYFGAGLAAVRRGAVESATGAAERAIELCKGREYPALWGIAASLLGAAYMLAGRHAEAMPILERSVDTVGALSAPVLVFLAEAYLGAGRTADAMQTAGRALGLAVDDMERGWEAWARWLTAEIDARGGPSVHGADAYRQALVLAEQLEMRPLVAHCRLGLAASERRAGKPQQAHEHLTVATALYREMGMTYWLEKAAPRG